VDVAIRYFLINKNSIYKILFASIILKLILLATIGYQVFLDGKAYMGIAELIYSNNFTYPNSEIRDAPGTPYFYSLFYPLSKIIGLNAFAIGNIIISTLSIYIFYQISLLIFQDLKIANISAFITLIYPFFNFYSISILTETLYIFLLYISFYYIIKFYKSMNIKYMILFSVFFALDTLVRFVNLSMFIFFIALTIIWMIQRKKNLLYIIKVILVSSFFFILTLSPWWIRNYHVFDEFVTTSVGESGKVFYSGNNPMNKSGGGIGGIDVDFSSFEHIKNAKAKDEAMLNAGIKWIKDNPKDWAILEIRKLIRLYSPIFFTDKYNTWYYNIISVMSYGVIFILFIVSLFKLKQYFWLYSPMLLYLILLTGVHLVFIASLRYRLPVEPFMIIMVSFLIPPLLNKIKI